MEEELVSQLLASAGLSALVGSRIYWGRRPQNSVVPAVVLFRITGGLGYTMQGVDSLEGPSVQCDCWGGSYGEAKAVARALRAAMHSLSAPFATAFVEAERDDFFGEDPERLHRTSLDVEVWFSAA